MSLRLIFVFSVILMMSLFSCKSGKNAADVQVSELKNQVASLNNKVDSLENVIVKYQRELYGKNPENLLFSIRRTPCLGTCPVYSFEVYRDGFVSYLGRKYVDLEGAYAGKLSPGQLKKAKEWFDEADFYSMKDYYKDARLDIPSIIIEYHGPEGPKKVEASTEIPQNFRRLASKLESLIDEVDWELD